MFAKPEHDESKIRQDAFFVHIPPSKFITNSAPIFLFALVFSPLFRNAHTHSIYSNERGKKIAQTNLCGDENLFFD